MIKKKEKGEYGYLQYKKVFQLLMTLGCFLAVMIILFGGIIFYGTMKNMMTVVAVVIVIPAAKYCVGYIVLIPYKSVDRRMYDELKDCCCILMTDLVITSEQKIMGVDIAAIRGKRVYCYIVPEKSNTGVKTADNACVVTGKYLKEILNSEFGGVAVKMFDNFDKYKEAVSQMDGLEPDGKDRRIKEILCIYTM